MKKHANAVSRREDFGFFALALILALLVTDYCFSGVWAEYWARGDEGILGLYTPFFFSKQFRLDFFPRLDLFSRWVAYPFGITSPFQSWVFEREYLLLIVEKIWGRGPWIQIYFAFSLVTTAVGLRWILRPYLNSFTRWWIPLSSVFLSFYWIHKVPEHYPLGIAHWSVLGVALDYRIFREWKEKQQLGFLLPRFVLLLASLGLELGYVAGIGCTSFTVLSGFVLWEWRKAKLKIAWKWPPFSTSVACCVLILFLSWLYLPLVFDIFRASRAGAVVQESAFGLSPVRLLFPWFPFFNPALFPLDIWLKDRAELPWDGAVGWFLFLPAAIAVWKGWKRKLPWKGPTLALLILFLIYHPQNFPILRILPWMGFARVAGRFTLVFPLLLSLIALELLNSLGRLKYFILLLASIETFTALYYFRNQRVAALTPEQVAYFNRIAETPGEAVFDWPFCATSANGIGNDLCPHFGENEWHYTWSRWHGKKTMGVYFGRLFEKDVKPLQEMGWPFLLRDIIRKGADCLHGDEMDFIQTVLAAHGFAGIQLHRTLLKPVCFDQMVSRFGRPVSNATFPDGQQAFFIPTKSQAPLISHPQYRPWISTLDADFLKQIPEEVSTSGLGVVREYLGKTTLTIGNKKMNIRAWLKQDGEIRFQSELFSLYPGQSLEMFLNGQREGVWDFDGIQSREISFTHPVPRGELNLEFRFKKQGAWVETIGVYERLHFPCGGSFFGCLHARLNLAAADHFYRLYGDMPAVFRQLHVQVDSKKRP